MEYFWLMHYGNEIENYQDIAFVGGLPKKLDGRPDVEHWGGPKGKTITFYETPIMEIAKGTKKNKLSDFYYGLHIIITEKVKRILDEYIRPDVCQFVPIIFKRKIVENLYIINPLVVVNCVIKEKTEYKKRGIIDFIVNPVLSAKDIPNIPIFVILAFPAMIVINQEINQLLSSACIKGFFSKKIDVE